MSRLRRALLVVALALLVPVVPLVVLGFSFEDRVAEWLNARRAPGMHFVLIVGVLAADIALPIPSSAVITYAGGSGLGLLPAVAASWLGLTAGAVGGFAIARWLGARAAAKLSNPADLGRTRLLAGRWGPAALVLTRALPILAEACVLLMGAARLSWRRFLIPVAAANLVIAVVYAACGRFFEGSDAFPLAVVASGTIPLAAALTVRRRLGRRIDD